ncbi:hypothetical protein C4580_00310 [Candidatus Woesearchaeota archaeon]|nr:MAG: hypothetical protein C4580_00310 [Candidatus Woesearchaeota archaeon]
MHTVAFAFAHKAEEAYIRETRQELTYPQGDTERLALGAILYGADLECRQHGKTIDDAINWAAKEMANRLALGQRPDTIAASFREAVFAYLGTD